MGLPGTSHMDDDDDDDDDHETNQPMYHTCSWPGPRYLVPGPTKLEFRKCIDVSLMYDETH